MVGVIGYVSVVYTIQVTGSHQFVSQLNNIILPLCEFSFIE